MSCELKGVAYFTLAEVAACATVSRQTLWRWRRERKVPQGRKYRGYNVLYTAAELRQIEDYANRIEPIGASEPDTGSGSPGDTSLAPNGEPTDDPR